MKKTSFRKIITFAAGVILASTQFAAKAQVPEFGATSVQNPCDRVGSGTNAFYFLVMEGESFLDNSKTLVTDPPTGFVKVYNDATNFAGGYNTPILSTNTTASLQGALGTLGPSFGRFADYITYQVVFSKPGDYYLYMRFSMFENGGNFNNYISEDSFFFPPDFNKDPKNDFLRPYDPSLPGQEVGGYSEGFGAHGFLMILNYGGDTNGPGAASRTDYSQSPSTNYWEGQFHWNQLFVSSFLNGANTNADGTAMAGQPIHYVVTPAMVGVPQNFTMSYREQGVTVDQWLFSTHTNMLNDYTQQQLDDLFVTKAAVQQPENKVVTATTNYPFLLMEAENYFAKTNRNLSGGFAAVTTLNTNVAFYGESILGTNTTASHKGALYTESPSFGRFGDYVSYRVQFAAPGDYYFYMRFTMYENGGNLTHYISEDSFFLPSGFNKDPKNDWLRPYDPSLPGQENGGYVEGFGAHGFLMVLDYHGDTNGPGAASRTDYSQSPSTNYWEGQFHWNQLFVSSFLNGANTNADGTAMAGQPIHYVVTPAMVGIPLDFTIAYRENGVTPDAWLFSTHTNLLNDYTQAQLDQQYLSPQLTVSSSGGNTVVSWPVSASCFILESTPSLSPPVWTAVPQGVQNGVTLSGSRYNLTIPTPSGNQFFRLRQP